MSAVNNEFVYSLDDIGAVVEFLKEKLHSCRVFAFYGPLGAGKTTIVRELLMSCGVVGNISSPTFTYMNCYKSVQTNLRDIRFFHFDLYRLNNLSDFFGAGFDEYLYDQDGISFVEWPEIIESILPTGACKIKIDYDEDLSKRFLSFEIVN